MPKRPGPRGATPRARRGPRRAGAAGRDLVARPHPPRQPDRPRAPSARGGAALPPEGAAPEPPRAVVRRGDDGGRRSRARGDRLAVPSRARRVSCGDGRARGRRAGVGAAPGGPGTPLGAGCAARPPAGGGAKAAEEDDDDETPAGLVRRASGAPAQTFDYEAARALLERATAGSGGAAEPAAALVSLLVETLGDDAAALALMPSLARAAPRRPAGPRSGLGDGGPARSGDEAGHRLFLRGPAAKVLQVAAVLAALAAGRGARGRRASRAGG